MEKYRALFWIVAAMAVIFGGLSFVPQLSALALTFGFASVVCCVFALWYGYKYIRLNWPTST